MAEVGTFPTDLCGCCAVKDCGCGCCLKLYCCFQCNYGSAMEAADLGACCLCCCCFSMFTQCVGCYNRGRLVEKYNIQESQCMSCLVYFFCPCCAAIQDMNLVCHKENKTWGCYALEGDSMGAPNAVDMQPKLSLSAAHKL